MFPDVSIRTLLATYQDALNTSDAALAASCYTRDGIFLPTTLPTAQGTALHSSYASIFDVIRLNVVFTIDEVVTTEDWAYALTRSNGTQTVLATGTEGTEANRELFIFRRENGAWKIARYMFNKAE